MVKNDKPKDRCPRCGKGNVVTDHNTGENFCGKCGFVITEKADESGPEWRSFSNEGENKSRAGVPTSLAMHDMGLSTNHGPFYLQHQYHFVLQDPLHHQFFH